MIKPLVTSAFLAALAVSSPAGANELFGGIYAHAVQTPLSLESSREDGASLGVGLRGRRIGGTVLQPYVFASANTNGGTNFVAAGLSARFGGKVYVRPGLGLAVHDGSAANFTSRDELAFGSRILFEPEIAAGVELSDRLSVEASWVHLSHGQLFGRQNPGLDNIGVRLNWKL